MITKGPPLPFSGNARKKTFVFERPSLTPPTYYTTVLHSSVFFILSNLPQLPGLNGGLGVPVTLIVMATPLSISTPGNENISRIANAVQCHS